MAGTGGSFLWERYRSYRFAAPDLGLSLDVSRVRFREDLLLGMAAAIASAMDAMEALEAGAIANLGERRMVGHYWLRAPDLAPTDAIRRGIEDALAATRTFVDGIHEGGVQGTEGPFEHVIHVGIGGSALGPQLLCEALGSRHDRLTVHFLDNADPDAVERLLGRLDGCLGRTLVSVVSKSGWTPTPWLLMLELEASYERIGLDFARHAVATTMEGTELDLRARQQRWLARLPVWDWVGGRTSVASAVGLLPAALQGVDILAFLDGAAAMDRLTRRRDPNANPAALLALMWYWLGNGRGDKNMVVLPYRDRLALLPRYLQQLVMESVGKKLDRGGATVHQGLTVYGNKGSTDQHAFVQQLRDGPADFFVTFVHVHGDRAGIAVEVSPGLTLGDHLFASMEGTRDALYDRERDSITIGLRDLTPSSLGALVALHERAVGLYAELIDVNAYDQPGVDKAAGAGVIELQRAAVAHLRDVAAPRTAEQVSNAIGQPERVETVYKVLKRMAADSARRIVAIGNGTPFGEWFLATENERPLA